MNKKYQVTGIGNAIIDILILTKDNLLQEAGLVKNSMTLIGRQHAHQLLNSKYEKIRSGGSAANTIAALADLKVKTAFIGKVGNGKYGKLFADDLIKNNIDFYCKNPSEYGSTARSFVFITPDGQRTMATYLGKASDVADEIEINKQVIADSNILYLEGYLWDESNQKTVNALKQAIKVAKDNNTKVAFTLSDSFCVARHKDSFLKLVDEIDILFANEAEIKSLITSEVIDFNLIKQLAKNNKDLIIAITRSEKGALIFDGKKEGFCEVPTTAVQTLDVTGAGDCFAAGFLYGLIKQYNLEKSAQIGNLIAGTIIKKLGARLNEQEVSDLTENLKKIN